MFLLTVLLISQACKKDDPCSPLDGAMYTSPVVPYISIELVDTEDNNLIANGTFTPSVIMVSVNGSEEQYGVFLGETKITIFPSGEKPSQIAVIKLNETMIDILEFNVTIEKNECNSIGYLLNAAIYNGENQLFDFLDESELYPRIKVVKE